MQRFGCRIRSAGERRPTAGAAGDGARVRSAPAEVKLILGTATIAILVAFAAGCGGGDEPSTPDDTLVDTTTAAPTTEPTFIEDTSPGTTPTEPTVVVRGQAFSENETLANVYGLYLEARGFPVEILPADGRRTAAIESIESGEIGMLIDYLGGSQAELLPDEPLSGDPDVTWELVGSAFEELGAVVLDYARADDDDAFVVRGDLVAARISDVRDLDLVFGAAEECFERRQCYLGYVDPDLYGIEFADTVVLDFGPPLGRALSDGTVDAVQWNATAPQIFDLGLKTLEDDLEIHPAQNVIPVVADELIEAYGDELARDINSLSAILTTEVLREWNADVDIYGKSPVETARDWLEDNRLLTGARATASNVVAALQRDLRELGYYDGSITGVYSLATEDAVLRFQIDAGLPPTGRFDQATAEAIQDALDRRESDAVAEVQRILTDLGWYTGPINGVYTPETVDAVRRFQAFLGVTADGVIGPETITAYETLCGDPDNCRRPPDTTVPPTTTTPAPTNPPATAPPATAPPATRPPTTAPPTTAPPTTEAPAEPTVRFVSAGAGLDDLLDVTTCEGSDADDLLLTAENDDVRLTIEAGELTRDEASTTIIGTVDDAELAIDGSLTAEGTIDIDSEPAWELTGSCPP